MIRRVGSHDAVDGGGVGFSDVVFLDESTELSVVADSLDSGQGEDPGRESDQRVPRLRAL